jgi:hypothetical protein
MRVLLARLGGCCCGAFIRIGYHESTVCVKHFLHDKRLTQREYNKQDYEREVRKVANVVVAMATMFMAVCAGIKLI